MPFHQPSSTLPHYPIKCREKQKSRHYQGKSRIALKKSALRHMLHMLYYFYSLFCHAYNKSIADIISRFDTFIFTSGRQRCRRGLSGISHMYRHTSPRMLASFFSRRYLFQCLCANRARLNSARPRWLGRQKQTSRCPYNDADAERAIGRAFSIRYNVFYRAISSTPPQAGDIRASPLLMKEYIACLAYLSQHASRRTI